MGETKSPGADEAKSSDFVTVLAAIAAAVGTLGWIAFIGGAISWIGFLKAGIPQAEAVAKIPKSVLVATGAEFVVAALIAALLTIGILYRTDNRLLRADTKRRVEKSADLHRRLRAKQKARDDAGRALRGLENEGEQQAAFQNATDNFAQAELDYEDAAETLNASSRQQGVVSARRVFLPGGLLTATALAASALVHVGYGTDLSKLSWLYLFLVALFAGGIGADLYRRSGSFGTIGLVALIAIPAVMGLATYFRAGDRPKVQPVALLKTDGTPFAGFLVAEADDRLYVGTFEQDASSACVDLPNGICNDSAPKVIVPAQLLSLPLADVRDLTIGPPRPLNADDALDDSSPSKEGKPRTSREWAGASALVLCDSADAARDKAEEARARGSQPGAAPEPLPATCSEDERADLLQFVKIEGENIK